MEFHQNPLIKHFPNLPRDESVVLDNSRISEYKACPRRYFYHYVLNLNPDENPPWFTWGACYHKFREVLEVEFKKYFDTSTRSNAKEACELSFQPAMTAAIQLWQDRIKDRPIDYDKKKFMFMNLNRFAESCAIAFKHWEKEKLTGNIEVIAIEQPYSVVLPNGIPLGGRFDQIIKQNGKLLGRDFKTTTKQEMWYAKDLIPNHQFIQYTWAETSIIGSRVQGQLIETVFTEEKKVSTIKSFPIFYNQEQINIWLEEVQFITDLMSRSREMDIYPMNEKACAYCPYHEVCKAPTEQSQGMLLKLKYKHRIWDCNAET